MSGMELSLKFVSVILGNEREREREKEKENCVNICMCNTHPVSYTHLRAHET